MARSLVLGCLSQASQAMSTRDRRYGSMRWRRLAKSVVAGYFQCWRPGCFRPATVADHIIAVYPGMPDAEFFSHDNLRPSCDPCNRGRALLGDSASAEQPPRNPLVVRSPYRRKPEVW